jgi:glycosyltransferase involved in cell wall biosynthesis
VVIENGVEPCGAPVPASELEQFAAGEPLAGLIGRLERQKDPIRLVRTFARVMEQGAPGRLAIVGNGSLAEAVRAEITASGLEGRARLFAFEPGRTADYLAAFDLFVLPSRWESLPISLLEAMACGVPVVASPQASSALQTRPERDLLVADTPAGFAAAIVRVLENSDLRLRLGAAGLRYVKSHHCWETITAQLEAFYEQCRESAVAYA